MADSFFGFDTSLERDALDDGSLSEDEQDYDALNEETFGDSELTGDWEENHEKLAEIAELSRRQDINENGDLSAQIAAFIFDDDAELEKSDILPKDGDRLEFSKLRAARPPPGFANVTTNNHHPPEGIPPIQLPIFKNICTVEEIERNLIKQTGPSLLEDIERNLITKPNLQLVNSHHQQTPYISVPPRPLQLLPKLPALPGPFPLPASSRFPAPRYVLQTAPLRLAPTSQPPFLRLTPIPTQSPLPHAARLPQPQQPPQPPVDEYAGLMTTREKHWLASIQLMQLSTNNPYQDDYYYTVYQNRQLGGLGRKGNVKQSRETPILSKAIYTPLQFENSLGKLQVGSVMAPRKIIDTDLVEVVDCPTSSSSSKKLKQILLEIEHLFSSILVAEEALSPFKTSSLENVNPNEIFLKAVNTLLKDDKLRTIINFKKGKALVLRILPHTDVSGPLSERLISVLPAAARRDSDQSLLRALPAIRHYLATATLVTLNSLTKNLEPHLSTLLENKFGISVIANMIERAEVLLASGISEGREDWLEFLKSVVSVSGEVERLERPVVGLQYTALARHISRLTPPPTNATVLLKAITNSASS